MATPIDLSTVVAPVPAVQVPLSITLPGGLVVNGITDGIASDALSNARAVIRAANIALAPLGPAFSIIDAILAIVAFAKAVPELVTNPAAVVEAIVDVIKKAGKLASLVPQLSVPLMIVGIIDAVIAFLNGITAELALLQDQVERIELGRSQVGAMPGPAGAALTAILDASQAQVDASQANLANAMAHINPLIGIVNIFCELAGLGPVTVEVDAAGGLSDTIDAIDTVTQTLAGVRSAIPV